MSCMPSSLYKPLTVHCIIAEPPVINGQVGAGGFVRYSEVSFIEKFYHNKLGYVPQMCLR